MFFHLEYKRLIPKMIFIYFAFLALVCKLYKDFRVFSIHKIFRRFFPKIKSKKLKCFFFTNQIFWSKMNEKMRCLIEKKTITFQRKIRSDFYIRKLQNKSHYRYLLQKNRRQNFVNYLYIVLPKHFSKIIFFLFCTKMK